ncbi:MULTISPECIES: thiamine pyrophosphate-binding protein [unclassified Pseudovibrio]|uniref:thiamine pyrophosphate-binding protein n=1 Tax=unclassified Pseudovibrio TaxID=2627060 RepID=UPI0007AEA198|nr:MULTISPECIES: thiamine pyrophosphate-binding protein [unclassified Pseudovibrio]KZL22425.1 Acetolactate synthase large subunit [Pseudovibrio sp. WM33]KZL22561.1 Acetolactate synthase large subunit [Pseudovibrio sp. Ad37]
MTNKMNGAEAMVKMLEAQGVQHIFGLCGDTTLPFYDAMYKLDHKMTHVLTRDERCATYMADAYSRVTGRPGVCEGPSGGGATYILPGLIEASESSYAVLGITTDISVGSYGKYPLTEVDQEALMRPLTKWNTVIKRADHIPRMVRKAFRAMTTGRSGAAHLGLPYDIQYDAVDASDIWADQQLTSYPAYPQAPAPGAAEAAVDAILSAKKPLIVCGGGVVIAGAMEELERLASRLDIPVATSISGQGSLAETHPNCVGVVGSNGGTDETWEAMANADLVVFMGARAGSTTTSRWEAPSAKTRVVHFDNDPMVIGANYEVEVGVVGDLKLSLAQVNAVLDKRDQGADTFGGAAAVADIKKRKFEIFNKLAQSGEAPIRPERVIDAMMKVLPVDATVISDPGTSCPYFSAYYQLPQSGRYFITNRAHGALGYSLSAALGAWYGRPTSKVVAMMGDGSFGFTCGELETVCRSRAPITYIVFSNSSYGWIKASQYADTDARYYNVDFNRTDQAAVAAAYGVKSWRVENPDDLERVLKEAIEHDGPTLIDVVTQPLEEANAPVRRWMG